MSQKFNNLLKNDIKYGRREEFRSKLERLGVLDALNAGLMALYDRCDEIPDSATAMQILAQTLYSQDIYREMDDMSASLVRKNVQMQRYIAKLKACIPADMIPPQSDDEDAEGDEQRQESHNQQDDGVFEDADDGNANSAEQKETLNDEKANVDILANGDNDNKEEASNVDAVNGEVVDAEKTTAGDTTETVVEVAGDVKDTTAATEASEEVANKVDEETSKPDEVVVEDGVSLPAKKGVNV